MHFDWNRGGSKSPSELTYSSYRCFSRQFSPFKLHKSIFSYNFLMYDSPSPSSLEIKIMLKPCFAKFSHIASEKLELSYCVTRAHV